MRYRGGGSLLPVSLLVFLAGCAEEPTEKMALAREATQAAMVAEAGEYAPDAMRRMNTLQEALDVELRAQAERNALTRRYSRAEALADSLKIQADATAVEASNARDQARNEANTLLAEVATALTETEGILASAPKGKGTAMDLAALRGDVDGAIAMLGEARAEFDAGRYRAAITRATAARDVLGRVRESVATARSLRNS